MKARGSRGRCNLLVLGLPTTSLLHNCPVFMTARGRQNASETRAAQRAERTRAGQNAEWSGSTSAAPIQGWSQCSRCMHPWSCTLLHLRGETHVGVAAGRGGRTRWTDTFRCYQVQWLAQPLLTAPCLLMKLSAGWFNLIKFTHLHTRAYTHAPLHAVCLFSEDFNPLPSPQAKISSRFLL